MLTLLAVPAIFAGFVLAFFGQDIVRSMLPPAKVEVEHMNYLTSEDNEKAESVAAASRKAFQRRQEISHWVALVLGFAIMIAAAEVGFG